MIDGMLGDIRYSLRQMVRAPLFTVVAVTILAVGISANSVLFSLIDTLLFRPVPGVADGGRLVQITGESEMGSVSRVSYELLRDNADAFSGLAASFARWEGVVEVDGRAFARRGEYVNAAVFTTLYTNPLTFIPLYVLAYTLGRFVTGDSTPFVPPPEMEWTWPNRRRPDLGDEQGQPALVKMTELLPT